MIAFSHMRRLFVIGLYGINQSVIISDGALAKNAKSRIKVFISDVLQNKF